MTFTVATPLLSTCQNGQEMQIYQGALMVDSTALDVKVQDVYCVLAKELWKCLPRVLQYVMI